MTTTTAQPARKRATSEGRAPRKENAALKSNGKYHPMVSALMKRIKGQPGNPYWLAFDAMIRLTGCNPWRWAPHWPQIVKEAAVRERIRRGELADDSGVEVSEVSTRSAHADRMLRIHVDGERAGTILKDENGWRVFGAPRTHYASQGDAVDALVDGKRALQELDKVGAVK